MTTIEGQQQPNRQMSEPGEYIPLDIVPLQSFREKHAFIFIELSTNHCRNCVNVNFNTNSYVCEIPNCTKFHTSYKFNHNISKIDIINCRYENDCKMKTHNQCRFIHSEQIERWYKFYLETKSIDKMIKLIFLEISRYIERHHAFYNDKMERDRQMERDREKEFQRAREIQVRRDYERRRDRSRSRERAPPPPTSTRSHNQHLEIERLNVEIEVAKKKKELMELSKMAESYKTQIDINKMVETAIASRMQSVGYQMPTSSSLLVAPTYQQYSNPTNTRVEGYQYSSGYGANPSSYQYSSGAGATDTARATTNAREYKSGVDPRGYQSSYGAYDRY